VSAGQNSVAVAPFSGMNNQKNLNLFLAISILGLLLKFYCVARREMIPETFDAIDYVDMSIFGLTGGAPNHPFGASLIMALSRIIGTPYRLFEEFFLAAGLVAMLAPLCRSRAGLICATAIYILCLFNPGGVLLMDGAMSDTPFVVWVMFSWAGILMAAQATQRTGLLLSLGWTFGAAALAGITRSEAVVFIATCVSAGALSFLLLRRIDRSYARNTAIGCVVAIVGFVGAEQTVNAINSVRYGFWGASYVESAEWWALYGTLLSLPSPERRASDEGTFTGPEVIALAGQLSPTFEEIRPCVEKQNRYQHWLIHWTFARCFGNNGPDEVGKTSRIIEEIKLHAAERGIELSPPLFKIIPHPFWRWVPTLPQAVKSVLSTVVQVPTSTELKYGSASAEALSWRAMQKTHGVAISYGVGGADKTVRSRYHRALLTREALSATGKNPNLPYQSLATVAVYKFLAIAGIISAIVYCAVSIRLYFYDREKLISIDKPAFLLGLLASVFVIYRIFLYSLVEWMLWRLEFRYAYITQFLSIIPAIILIIYLFQFLVHRQRPQPQ
jgi:hypothetical protein